MPNAVRVEPSSHHVRVELDGVTIAESSAPLTVFEAGTAVRYYLPRTHVRMDLLEPTDTVTHCPRKGAAEYWSIRVGEQLHRDLAWSYRTPLPAGKEIAGLIAFCRVDTYVDAHLQDR